MRYITHIMRSLRRCAVLLARTGGALARAHALVVGIGMRHGLRVEAVNAVQAKLVLLECTVDKQEKSRWQERKTRLPLTRAK